MIKMYQIELSPMLTIYKTSLKNNIIRERNDTDRKKVKVSIKKICDLRDRQQPRHVHSSPHYASGSYPVINPSEYALSLF